MGDQTAIIGGCGYCGHSADEHGAATDDFPTGCMHYNPDAKQLTYRDAENLDGHCLCPALEVQGEMPARVA